MVATTTWSLAQAVPQLGRHQEPNEEPADPRGKESMIRPDRSCLVDPERQSGGQPQRAKGDRRAARRYGASTTYTHGQSGSAHQIGSAP